MKPEQPSYRLTADTIRLEVRYLVSRGNTYLRRGDSFYLCPDGNQLEIFRRDGKEEGVYLNVWNEPQHVFAGVKGDIDREFYRQRLADIEAMYAVCSDLVITDQVLRES